MFVELLGAVMKRMDQQCSDASVEGHSDSAVDGILQQGRPQVHALGTSVKACSGTGTGSRMLRRATLVAIWCETAPPQYG